MEPWPAVAWVIITMVIADWMETAHTRDFTENDIIYLHPSTTPYPGGFKCFTCEEAQDNYECNRWAPDLYCPKDARYCYTQHEINLDGNTVSVTKRCVALNDCLSTGCADTDHEGHRVCTACCEGNICNLPLPRNESDAIFATTSPLSSAPRPPASHSLLTLTLTLTLTLLFFRQV
ncbi:ly6/PLAUR domain-containing protein 6 [Clupea harengus]|uniref:Ly6/PLAUR domain-containing protein 6 n=1 Tax=Clupea harengus TaxID=7950 RepID=A0A6P3VL71_CLUHA|nr:ly6/PLAUR domain-containing protein 6 [Clupea harengus]